MSERCKGCEELEKVVWRLNKEVTGRVDTLEKNDILKGEQYNNIQKSILDITKGQQEMKESQSQLILRLMDKQDDLMKVIVKKNDNDSKGALADRKSERELILEQEKLELEEKKLQTEKQNKIWANVFKVILSVTTLIGVYLGITN